MLFLKVAHETTRIHAHFLQLPPCNRDTKLAPFFFTSNQSITSCSESRESDRLDSFCLSRSSSISNSLVYALNLSVSICLSQSLPRSRDFLSLFSISPKTLSSI